MNEPRITVQEIAHHRNGICGIPFHVVTFRDEDEDRDMLGVVFNLSTDDDGRRAAGEFYNPPTAVFDRALLREDVIEFGVNSWRGDRYDDALREAIGYDEDLADLEFEERETEIGTFYTLKED